MDVLVVLQRPRGCFIVSGSFANAASPRRRQSRFELLVNFVVEVKNDDDPPQAIEEPAISRIRHSLQIE